MKSQGMKSMYRFKLRTLADPPEHKVLEAGPFTPPEASSFAQLETAKTAISTGRPWVCDYGPIKPDDPEVGLFRGRSGYLPISVIMGVFFVIVSAVSAVSYFADKRCRDRAEHAGTHTLCSGEAYAVDLFGDECGCKGAP